MRILTVAAMLVAASAAGAVQFVDLSETGGAVVGPRTATDFAASNGVQAVQAHRQTEDIEGKAIDYVPVSLIPEPAIWGLLIAGFSLVGVSARRRALRRAHLA